MSQVEYNISRAYGSLDTPAHKGHRISCEWQNIPTTTRLPSFPTDKFFEDRRWESGGRFGAGTLPLHESSECRISPAPPESPPWSRAVLPHRCSGKES